MPVGKQIRKIWFTPKARALKGEKIKRLRNILAVGNVQIMCYFAV